MGGHVVAHTRWCLWHRVHACVGGQLHMEPGRYMVSEAGVLLLHVTQVRTKGGFRFVGADSGMNALIRYAATPLGGGRLPAVVALRHAAV